MSQILEKLKLELLLYVLSCKFWSHWLLYFKVMVVSGPAISLV